MSDTIQTVGRKRLRESGTYYSANRERILERARAVRFVRRLLRRREADPLWARFWSRMDVGSARSCWGWLGQRSEKGYGVDGDGKTHRSAWEIAQGRRVPDGLQIQHWCDFPACGNPIHLYSGSALGNAQDRERRGRGHDQCGGNNNRAKLNAAQVAEIRARRASGESKEALAAAFGISRQHVHNILMGRYWKATS